MKEPENWNIKTERGKLKTQRRKLETEIRNLKTERNEEEFWKLEKKADRKNWNWKKKTYN